MVSDVTELDDDSKSKGRPVSYDVIYDESDADGEDEEDGVVANRVVSVAVTSPCVSCAARLNLARCLFKVPLHSEVRVRECMFRSVCIRKHVFIWQSTIAFD